LSNSSFRGENLVVAGNFADAYGGGVRFASVGPFDLYDSTVAGNTVGASGVGPALAGSGGALSLINSIVYGNGASPALEISSFSATGSFSDACQPDQVGNPVPIAGGGNICVDPLLVNPSAGIGDVHETAASPTIDRGSNALVPPPLSTDYEGEARISDGNNDASAVVDMGADERPFNPTAVSVSLFTARGSRAGVRLRWRTGAEAERLGFNLYRQQHGKLVKLNRTMIPSVFGDTATGHTYSWLDRSAPSRAVSYRLQAVSLSGKRNWVGGTTAGAG
jgi:hypothetical protein